MKQAQNYLQQYRYTEVTIAEETESGEIINSMETRLWVKFDEDNLNQALRRLSVPVWGRERPSTLVWLAVSDQAGRRLIGLEDGAEYVQPIDQRAGPRGIALLHPLVYRLHSARAMAISGEARLAMNTDRPTEPINTKLLEY